jgi:hypothetical protein
MEREINVNGTILVMRIWGIDRRRILGFGKSKIITVISSLLARSIWWG